jgi:hypothetical protein
VVGTRFLADWIRSRFDQQIRLAANAVGLRAAPPVRPRSPSRR